MGDQASPSDLVEVAVDSVGGVGFQVIRIELFGFHILVGLILLLLHLLGFFFVLVAIVGVGAAVWILGEDEPAYSTYVVEKGDTLFFYTDGLIELWNGDDDMLEREDLEQWLEETRSLNPQELVDALYHRAIDFAGSTDLPDDVAELAVRVETT